MNNKIILTAFFCTSLLSANLFPNQQTDKLTPVRLKETLVIDGKLDEQIWKEVSPISSFVTYMPDYGKKPSQETEVLTSYDSENIYFAFRCFDSQPDKIKSSITNRDNIYSDDFVCINIDSYNDQQTSTNFYVNPHGIQADSKLTGGQENFAFDAVWYSAAQINSNGYIVEVQIPLKSLRYSSGNPVTMRIIFERRIARITEQCSFPVIKPGKNLITQMIPIEYYDIEKQTLFELLHAIVYSNKYSNVSGNLNQSLNKGEISLTTKYGITSDLILDATYNPDFSQVESDAGQVDINLRYSLYYPEKRSFFLEGSENFRIAGVRPVPQDPLRFIVNTRNIINPIAGVKLTGKIGEKNTLALLYAADKPLDQSGSNQNYIHNSILRYKRSFNNDSYTGAIFTDKEISNGFSRVLGVDGFQRLNETSALGYYLLFSNKNDVDLPAKESGNSFYVRYTNLSRELDWRVNIGSVSENFNADLGYLTRRGVLSLGGVLIPKFYPASSFVRQIQIAFGTDNKYEYSSNLWETQNEFTILAEVWGASTLLASYVYATEIFNKTKFDRSWFWFTVASQVNKQVYFDITYSPTNAIYYSNNPYQGFIHRISVNTNCQPSDNINTELNYTYSDFYRVSDNQKIYSYQILRGKLTYQINQHLFIRGIAEYNDYRKELTTDFLASFTYIPGTVIYLGYGSLYKKNEWNNNQFIESNHFLEMKRGFFLKMSYLWRV